MLSSLFCQPDPAGKFKRSYSPFRITKGQTMRLCIAVMVALMVHGSTADLEWNSLSDYLNSFRAESGRDRYTTEEEDQPANPMLRSDSFEGANGRFDVAKLMSRLNRLNITAPETPPLLQMYPGSLDNSTEMENGYGEDVSLQSIRLGFFRRGWLHKNIYFTISVFQYWFIYFIQY